MSNDTSYKVCSICNNLVDSNNIFNIKDEEICKTCIEKKLEEKENINPFTTFICSLIPGVGQIYLGKKEKGTFLFTIFIILNISLISIISIIFFAELYNYYFFEILMNLLTILFFVSNIGLFNYSIIDANFSRKYIENDKYIEGLVDKLAHKYSTYKNKKSLEEKIIDKRLQ